MALHYILILVLVLFAFFFAAMEVAFVSANKLRIELDKKRDRYFSQIIELFIEKPAQYYATMAIGNMAVVVTLAMVLTGDGPWRTLPLNAVAIVAIEAGAACLLYLLAGEILPKLLAFKESGSLLKIISLPASVFYYMFYLVSKIVYHTSRFITNRLASKKVTENDAVYWGLVDWDSLANEQINEADDDDEPNEMKLFRNALDFSDVKLRECMVPRPEIVAISINDSLDELKKLFVSSGLSKIIVFKGSIDNVVGFAPSISMFQHPANIAAITRNLPIVPESMPANKLLALFIQNHRSIALVVDEFGGTSGLVTLEDVIEEILGEINDEFDDDSVSYRKTGPDTYVFEGKTLLSDFFKILDLDDETFEEVEGDADSLAGLLLEIKGDFPELHERIDFRNFTFEVTELDGHRISKIKVVIHS